MSTRAFFGVPLPCSDALQRVVDELKASGADLKVVPPKNVHLTLKFLGEVSPEVAHQVADNARLLTLPKPFEITMRGCGAFPNPRRPNVFWVGINDPATGLPTLHKAVEEAGQGSGFAPEDRPFAPHLTIARKRSDRDLDAACDIVDRHKDEDFGSSRVDQFHLYRSTLGPSGPTYDVVETIPL